MKQLLLAFTIIICFSFTSTAEENGNTATLGNDNVETNLHHRRSDRKIIELKKIMTISPTQEEAIRTAYEKYCQSKDSILYNVNDPYEAAVLNRETKKTYDSIFIKSLTEYQINHYISIISSPEIREKAAAKIEELRESGQYTSSQLDSAQISIENYLMKEKLVYFKHKYNYRKQKDNIAQLKKKRPLHLKKAEAHEKMRINRKSGQGRIIW